MVDRADDVVRDAIRGMLPKNRLGRQMATKLKVYRGEDHPHTAQCPVPMEIPGARRTAPPAAALSGRGPSTRTERRNHQ